MSRIALPVAALVAYLLGIGLALADVKQITHGDYYFTSGHIDGSNVVFFGPGAGSYEVFLYNDSTATTTRIGEGDLAGYPIAEGGLRISGSSVVWQTVHHEIALYDGVSVRLLTNDNDGLIKTGPCVSGPNVVWDRAGSVRLYDGTTTRELNTGLPLGHYPEVSGSNVVWWGSDNGVYFYDGQNITTLNTMPAPASPPQVSGPNVVWQQRKWLTANADDVFFYDGRSTRNLTDDEFRTGGDPRISGSNVIWTESDSQQQLGALAMLFDGTTMLRLITASDTSTFNPPYYAVDGTRVAWAQNGLWLRLFEAGHTYTINTLGFPVWGVLGLSGRNVLWTGYDVSVGRSELYLATPPYGFTPDDPIPPRLRLPDGSWEFPRTGGHGGWFDPEAAFGYRYTTDGESNFLEVAMPPDVPDEDGQYTITYGEGTSVVVPAGGSYLFPEPVSSFSVTGIYPWANADDPLAFPTYLRFDHDVVSFTMTPLSVPEPSALVALMGMGLAALAVWGGRKRSRAARDR